MNRGQIKQMGLSYDQLSPKLQEAVEQFESTTEQISEIQSEFDELDEEEKEEAREELATLKVTATNLSRAIKSNISSLLKRKGENNPTQPIGQSSNNEPEEKKGNGLFWILGVVGLGLLGFKALKK